MPYLVVRTKDNEPYCEECYALENDMINAIEDEDGIVQNNVLCVVNVGVSSGANRIGVIDLEKMVLEHRQQIADERETEAFHSRSGNFI